MPRAESLIGGQAGKAERSANQAAHQPCCAPAKLAKAQERDAAYQIELKAIHEKEEKRLEAKAKERKQKRSRQ